MKKLKLILNKIFCLPPFVTVIVAVPSFVFVAVILAFGDKSFASYIAYGVSAYALIICVTGFSKIIKSVKGGFKDIAPVRALRSTKWGARLMDDTMFRSKLALAGGLLANLFYAALNVYSSFTSPSSWTATMAVYYVLLTAMRAVLAKYMYNLGKDVPRLFRRREPSLFSSRYNPLLNRVQRCCTFATLKTGQAPYLKNPPGQNMRAEYIRERAVGIMLLIMNTALAAMTVYMVYQNKGSSYSGIMIYAMATYTFYITISAIVNICRIRRQNSPVMSAVRVISLTASLVSMMSLARAMINEFDKSTDEFRKITLSCMGAVTCVAVTVMAIFMIAKSTKRLKILKQTHNTERSAAV